MLLWINPERLILSSMEPILKGILSGLAYGLLLGPLFFMNLRTTLTYGVRHGVALVLGAFSADSLMVLTSWWGASRLEAITSDGVFQSWFGLSSGLLLLGFGLAAVWPNKQKFEAEMSDHQPIPRRRYTFLQGFSLNMSNPANWLFWLGLATVARVEAPAGSDYYGRLFMGSALLSLFSADLSKTLLAHQIGKRLKPGVPELIVRIAGFILIGVSGWILVRVGQNYFFR